jgi:hypothetical protein
MATTYTLNESWGTDAHTLATGWTLDQLPSHARAAVAADPQLGEWRVPALGDHGEELDDLALVIIAEG